MKRLTEGTHQTTDDLVVANAEYSLNASFRRAIVPSGVKDQTYSQLGCGW